MSFINPIFLIGLSAAVLPVLFHLVKKMKAKRVAFGSVMFLKATPKEVVRRRRLRDVLLMVIRSAIFALLAMAFARPFIPRERIPFLPQRERRSVVLLVDNSFSMRYQGVFEAARHAALDRLDAAAGGDEFAVVSFSDEVQQLTDLSDDLTLHRDVLTGALQPGYRPTDYYPALRRAEEILRNAHNDARTVVLISDFQAAGWSGALENWKLARGIVFEPVKVGAGTADNVYVSSFALTQRRVGSRVALRYDGRVAAMGVSAAREHVARLVVEDAEVEQRALPAIASSTVSFQQIAAREGVYQGSLALATDALPADDRFYFTYIVAPRPSILVIDEGPRDGYRDAFFLGKAFDLGDDAPYRFDVDTRRRLRRAVLRDYDVVFLAGVPALSADQVETLSAYVAGGGSVVVSFGEASDLDAVSSFLRATGVGHVDGRVDARERQGADAIIGEVDERHPVFAPFGGTGAGALLRPRFRRYARLVPDSSAVVAARFDTGDPFLVERRVGEGRVLAYAATFNTDWTDFPIHEAYVPFVYQLVKQALRGATVPRIYTVGDPVTLRGRAGDVWEVRTPDDRLLRTEVGDGGLGFFRDTDVPGHYAAERGDATFSFSVNVDPRESDLSTRDAEEVYAAVVPPPDDVATTPEQAAVLAVQDEEKEQKLWRVLLLIVIALFVLETLLANRILPRAGRFARGGR